MADLDDFFKKKDKKKKKGEKKFARANTDVLAKNLKQMAVEERRKQENKAVEKEILEMKKVLRVDSNMLSKEQMLVTSIKWLAIMTKVTSKIG